MLVSVFGSRLIAAEPQVDSAQLPRVPATPPEKAVGTFKVRPGFRIELVAAETLVVDPIAMSFDEDGRCYVVEMRDYSERRPERLGRIRLLEDTNGDGRLDKSAVFAQDLPWPTAVLCWDGGVFVGATPDIIYFKDTNGDGVAEVREVIFSGFASDYAPFATNKLNVQALMNSFNWSLDNRIHGATSFSGGKVKRVDSPFVRDWLKRGGVSPSPGGEGGPPETRNAERGTRNEILDLRGRDFSFDPRTLEMRAESGGGQHGLSFDNRGRKFVCSNSSHIQTLMYEERYAGRNPFYSMPRALVEIAADGGAAPVFRISPDEPWRVIRTQWRVSGLVSGPIEGGGRPSGYFTGATGITIYRGDAYGPEFVGDAFVGDAGGNLVHRKKILPDGVGVKAVRPADEEKTEFLASTDNWFRPVQMANAPDGCLYICDMYREVIEHPWSLPDSLKKHLDLNSGNDRGRIYRVVPEKFKQRPLPRLSKANSAELVALLEHPNGWHRDTAARLLCERQDESVITGLVQALTTSTSPLGRLHALHALDGISPMKETTVLIALDDADEAVRAEAIKMAERFLTAPSEALWQKLNHPLAYQREPSTRYQLALTAGETRHPQRLDLLARLAENQDPWIRAAVLNSLQDGASELSARLYGTQRSFSYRRGIDFFLQLVRLIGAHARPAEVESMMDLALSPAWRRSGDALERGFVSDLDIRMVTALKGGAQSSGRQLDELVAPARLQPILARAQRIAADARSPVTNRVLAVSVVGSADYSQAAFTLVPLLDALHPTEVQSAALKELDRFPAPELADELIQRWSSLTPSTRPEALLMLLKRPERIRALLAAFEKGLVNPAELSAAQQTQLRSHRDTTIRERAAKVLGRAPAAARQSVVEAFQSSLALTGVAKNGLKTFQARCATCHKSGKEGHPLGPDLATVKNSGKEKLLTNILDPNREVNPNYVSYLVETKDGESLSGLVVNENSNRVTLRMAGGAESVIARANISSLQSQGKSLMPEGLEEGLSQQDMADLLEFIIATP